MNNCRIFSCFFFNPLHELWYDTLNRPHTDSHVPLLLAVCYIANRSVSYIVALRDPLKNSFTYLQMLLQKGKIRYHDASV